MRSHTSSRVHALRAAFTPDYRRYGGIRPIQVLLLRVGYIIVFALVGLRSWSALFSHPGGWDPFQAVAISMWASSSLLSLIGVFRPVTMVPLVLFEIGYKSIWLAAVSWPLWSTGRLAGSSAEELTYAFLPVAFPIVLMPWGYVFRTYLWGRVRPGLTQTTTSPGSP